MNHDSKNSLDYDALAKQFAGSATDHELSSIERWRKSAHENEVIYQQLYLVWLDTGVINDSPKLSSEINLDQAWGNLNQRIDESEKIIPITKQRSSWRKYAAIAAVIILLIGGYFTTMIAIGDQEMMQLQASTEIKSIDLNDGTK